MIQIRLTANTKASKPKINKLNQGIYAATATDEPI